MLNIKIMTNDNSLLIKAGVTFDSTSKTEPLVILRSFGPAVNPDATTRRAYRKNQVQLRRACHREKFN